MNRNWLLALFLLAATFIAYLPVWHIAYIRGEGIDSDLSSWHGLGHIWTQQGEWAAENHEPGKAYYPLTYTTFWLEYHLWGLKPLGYHLDNVLLQALDAILLAVILSRLSVCGAWLAAAMWALHPVNVESVAWIAERKNTLSGFFYLGSILAALKYWLPAATCAAADNSGHTPAAALTPQRREGLRVRGEGGFAGPDVLGPALFYWFALALYVLGLLCKSSIIPMPAVVLLLVWWKRDRLLWRDVRPVLLFFLAGIALGLETMHVERNLGTIEPATIAFPLADRCLVAGWDVWFYLGKLIWPHPLTFVYPRWKIDPSSAEAWLQVLAVPALLLVLWLKRNTWGRPMLVASLYFLALLAPVLSFVNFGFFRSSFVADHFQYLACMGPLTLAAAGIVLALARVGNFGRVLALPLCGGLLIVLGALTWNQCRMYRTLQSLWETTLDRNPDAYAIRGKLGALLLQNGHVDAAIEQFQQAVRTHWDEPVAYELGNALLEKGRPDEAMAAFRKTLEMRPDSAIAYDCLGHAYLARGQMDAAITNFQKAVSIQPNIPVPYYDLGCAYAQIGMLDPAIRSLQKAVDIEPDFAPAHNNLANALSMEGRVAEAEAHWRAAVKSQPELMQAQINLAWALATCPEASLRNGAQAVALAQLANQRTGGRDPAILRVLAAADAENGQIQEAMAVAQSAQELAALRGNDRLANIIKMEIKFYQDGLPFRDTTMGRQ